MLNRPLRALLVEDSEDDAELVVLALKRGGLEVAPLRVDTRPEMEQALAESDWDIIIADYAMPRFSLDEAMAVARESASDAPIVIVSATIFEEHALHAMREGARDFIMKDKLGRLAPAVEREVREAAARRERKRLDEHVRQNQKMESLGVLAGGVAHDFNNLLVGIMGNASLAIDMLPPASRIVPLLEDVVLASQKAADLTRQMLAYAGKGRFVSEPTNLATLIEDITGLVRTSISKNVVIDLELDPHTSPIEGDPTQIQQVVMNLLINGAEAIGDRPGTVRVVTGEREETSASSAAYLAERPITAGRYVYLRITDNGCGMDEATSARIFEPFFTTKFAGRGLGLAAALGIIRSHKGALKVESELGRGTSFEILFPVSATQPQKTAHPSRQNARNEPTLPGTILVVDDEELVRRAAKGSLERHGYSVLLAEDGESAVNTLAAARDRVALVLLDLTMPGMGSEETFDLLRSMRPGLEMILTSGYDQSQVLRNFPADEAPHFLQKPYTGDALAELVRFVLSKRAAIA